MNDVTKQEQTWAQWFSHLHTLATTTWLGVFMVWFLGAPAVVAMWWIIAWLFPTVSFIAIVCVAWAFIASGAVFVYGLLTAARRGGRCEDLAHRVDLPQLG